MTVHVLDTPLQLPKPDLTVVTARRTELKRSAGTLGEFYLPVVREALSSLITELGEVDKQALHIISAVPGLMNREGLRDLLQALTALQEDNESGRADVIAQIVAEIDASLLEVSSGLNEHAQALDNALLNCAAVSLGDIEALMAPINAEVVRIDAEITAVEAPLARLREEETTLNKLIKDLESVNFFDMLKPLVDNLKKLADIDPKNPLVGSIQEGIEAMSAILQLSSDALKYEHLVSRRKSSQQQVDDIQAQTRELRSLRNKETEHLAQLERVQGMETPRNEYMQELGKLREALKRFNGYAFTGEDSGHSAARFIASADILSNYMDELRRGWQS